MLWRKLCRNTNGTVELLWGHLESKLSKYYNDAIFYKYTVEHSKDEIRADSAQMRFEIAMDECMRIRDQIENYLFDK